MALVGLSVPLQFLKICYSNKLISKNHSLNKNSLIAVDPMEMEVAMVVGLSQPLDT